MEINNDILNLILKHLQGKASANEQEKLEQWLKANEDHQQEYQKIADIWGASENLNVDIDVDEEWNAFRSKHFDSSTKGKVIQVDFRMASRIAAAAVLIIGVFLLGRYFFSPETYTTSVGERLMVNLDDGTSVILGENSELMVSGTFNKTSRNVELHGEGFFTVAKNPEKPFTISGPATGTQVLGTEFRLLALDDKNTVQISGGKVAYWKNGRRDTLILTRGEEGVVEAEKLIEREVSDPNFNSWKTGDFIFENQKIDRVLKSLQNHYVFNVENLKKLESSECQFSGKFENQPLEEILEELSLVMGLEFEWNKGILTINGMDCI